MKNEITIHSLKAHQRKPYESGARFKVLRCGRRWGKDAFSEHVSLLGHGPAGADNEPVFKGLIHGLDVVWLAPSIPQASALWKNEVEPRFRNREHVAVNKNEKTVTLLNPDGSAFATLWVRSAEAIHSVRGIGKKLAGVVINEAAWMDLETAWRDVLRPTLMDCGGWAIIQSTTNGGPDGYETEEGKRSPSFFNLICRQIQAGERGPEWEEFYGTALDNPTIRPEEFKALIEEYPDENDPRLQQEVFAKLIVGGAGVAFPEWRDNLHISDHMPERTREFGSWSGGMDWGYDKPGCFLLFFTGPEGSLARWEYYFKKTTPYRVGFHMGQNLLRFPRPDYIALDSACWAVTDGGPTVAEEIQRGLRDAIGGRTGLTGEALLEAMPPVISVAKGAGSRTAGKMLVHEALRWEKDADGNPTPWSRPRLRIHRSCTNTTRTMPELPRDPHGKEDVDTDAEDHAYDALRYWLMARAPQVEREQPKRTGPDDHPGFTADGQRRDQAEDDPWAALAAVSTDSSWRIKPEGD